MKNLCNILKSNMDKTSKMAKGKKLVMTTNRITQFTAMLFADTGWMAEMKRFISKNKNKKQKENLYKTFHNMMKKA